MPRSRSSIFAGLLGLLTALACSDNPTAVNQAGSARPTVIVPTETLDQSIGKLLELFPKGLENAATTRWSNVKRNYAAGLTDPSQMKAAKQMLFELSDWVSKKTPEMETPPNNETKSAAAARAVLYMSMYIYSGPGTSPPPYTPSADAVVGIVTPGSPATIVTPTKHAGVQFEAGSVDENTVVVVTQNLTPFPANCSGPLQTKLCQYPLFYTFEQFPDKRLLKAAKFAVCHVNSGEDRHPLADHDRFRLAHSKPANPADYTPGSTIRDQDGESIEILPLVEQTFSTCDDTHYAINPARDGLTGLLSRLAQSVQKIVTPKKAYAIDVGLGGLGFDMSPFNVVDPLSSPDLTVESMTVTPALASPGHLTLSYSVKNIGTATRGSVSATIYFTREPVIIEGPPQTPVDQQIASIALPSLAPGSINTRTDVDLTVPEETISGTYHVKFILETDPTFPDASTTNDSASVVISLTGITVLGAAPGFSSLTGCDINDAGHVAGFSYPLTDGGIDQTLEAPFLWAGGTFTSLGITTPANGCGFAINNSDEIVGAQILEGGLSHAFRWKNGSLTDLGTLSGTSQSYAIAINNLGQVLGNSFGGEGGTGAWVWQNGAFTSLGDPPFQGDLVALGINDAGQVTGTISGGVVPGGARAFIWQNGVFTLLPAAFGTPSNARAINGNGVVVGFSRDADDHERAAKWENGTVTELFPLPGDTDAEALAINDSGQIVGISHARWTRSQAVLWQNGQTIKLDSFGASYSLANAINSSGQITGWAGIGGVIWQAPPF